MSWSEFLQYAASPGIAAIVGAILSVVVEYLPEYDNLEPKWKRLVFFGLCMVVPLAATALAIATGEWGAWGDVATTWWPAVYAGLTGAGFGSLFHAWAPEPLRRG